MAPPAYAAIKSEDSDPQDELSFVGDDDASATHPRRKFRPIHIVALVQSVLLALSCALLAAIWRPIHPVHHGSFQTGWRDTELHAAFDAIKIQRMTIDQPAGLATGPPQSEYVGEPSEELDNAWRILVAPTVLDLNKHEIGDYAEQTVKTESGWTSGLQVYHNLHCINALRRAVYQHVYGTPSKGELYHLDHCIDMLRLGAQCQSDLTPMLYVPTSGTMGIKPHEHTCRNFSAIHEWARARSRCKYDTECAIRLGKEVGAEM
ncbi:Tat pathway signal sequence [Apiospora arundinis]|uniref:Tat pathway signal sequence n=1 Tax=Apiospora arundinis TaxID=335852 RepID=A0ABR2I3M1_9PEZI